VTSFWSSQDAQSILHLASPITFATVTDTSRTWTARIDAAWAYINEYPQHGRDLVRA
jgi:hypothetical protein